MNAIPPPEGSSTSGDDVELVERFKLGEVEVFAVIAARYRRRLAMVAMEVLHDAFDAEEVAQDALAKAYVGLTNFRGDSSLATWLHRIARNLACNRHGYFCRRRRQDSVSLQAPLGRNGEGAALGELLESEQSDPAHDTARREFSQLVAESTRLLDGKYREILTLRNVLDLSYAEIARLLDLPACTVKSRISRAREQLRELLLRKYPEFRRADHGADYFLSARPLYGAPRRG